MSLALCSTGTMTWPRQLGSATENTHTVSRPFSNRMCYVLTSWAGMMTAQTSRSVTNWNGGPGPSNNVENVHMKFFLPKSITTLNGTGWGGLKKEEVAFK